MQVAFAIDNTYAGICGGGAGPKKIPRKARPRAQRTALRGWAYWLRMRLQWDVPGWVRVRRRGLGLFGWQSARGDEEGFAVGVEARGLSGDVSGGGWVRLRSAKRFVGFGLGLQNGFVR